jgi:hypothetical protein
MVNICPRYEQVKTRAIEILKTMSGDSIRVTSRKLKVRLHAISNQG